MSGRLLSHRPDMSTNATSLPLPRSWAGARRGESGEHTEVSENTEVSIWRGRVATGLLMGMFGVGLFIVIVAANRPSFIVPPSAQHYFPNWLAGPLGGLWPQFPRSTRVLDYVFTYGVLAMYAAYVAVVALVGHVRARWVIAAVLAIHLLLFVAPPLALTDIFNYLNYGRMEIVHGLNPYATIPILEPHDDPAFAMSNWHHLLSPYGPMFTIITFALVPLGVAASFWCMKAILMLASLGTLALVWRCARLLGRDPRRAVVFVGLNPVVLMWGLGGDHNDFITIFFIMLAFYLLLRGRAVLHAARDTAVPAASVTAPPPAATAGVVGADHGLAAHGAKVTAAPAVAATAAVAGPSAAGGAAPVAGTPAVAGTAGMARSPLGFAEPAVAPRVSRRALGDRLTRAVEVAGAGAAALRPRSADASAEAPVGHADRSTEAAARSGIRRRAPSAEMCAGASLIVAVSMKASAAILIPVLLLGLAWSRRRTLHFGVGMVVAALIAAAATYVAFGAHIPDLSTQDKVVTAESLPNLLGLLLGQGGETATLRTMVQATLVVSVLWAGWWAWRHRDFLTPAAWATVALLATLSWVLPWYVLWLLPLAALAGSRALQRLALGFGIFLILVWAPLAGTWYAAIGFAPTKTALGQAHQRDTKFLLH